MNENQIVKSREKIIKNLTESLIQKADGVNIVGDGENLVRNTPNLKIINQFTDGVYLRRMEVDKGFYIIGAVHKHLHAWFLMKGEVTIAKREGTEHYAAPCYVISEPGSQRIIYANEDTIFITIHKNPDNITDIDELEKQICCMTRDQYEEYLKNQEYDKVK